VISNATLPRPTAEVNPLSEITDAVKRAEDARDTARILFAAHGLPYLMQCSGGHVAYAAERLRDLLSQPKYDEGGYAAWCGRAQVLLDSLLYAHDTLLSRMAESAAGQNALADAAGEAFTTDEGEGR
jgi:hypothetical protein